MNEETETKKLSKKEMREYKIRQSRCKCLSDERRSFIEARMDHSSSFPDGAFIAYMEEQGIDMSELECFSIDHNCGTEK